MASSIGLNKLLTDIGPQVPTKQQRQDHAIVGIEVQNQSEPITMVINLITFD